MRVAAVQLNCHENVEENLRSCREQVLRAADAGATLVALPENFAFLGPEPDKQAVIEELGAPDGRVQAALREMAAQAGVYVLGGGMAERSADPRRPHNTSVLIAPTGELLAAYRKIHLFDVNVPGATFAESNNTTPGTEPIVVELDGLRFGLSICYDLRFPEYYRRLVERGAQVLLVPAAFTLQTGKDHWHVLLRARAIENTCWVVAPAQWGPHRCGRQSYGHALIVDPWGIVTAECSDGVGFAMAEVDAELLRRTRQYLPSLTHRRF